MKLFRSLSIMILIASIMMAGGIKAFGSEQETNNEKDEKIVGSAWPEPSACVIIIKADGDILHYQRESFWHDQDFPEILTSRKKYETDETETFKNRLERYQVEVSDITCELNTEMKSCILKSDVKGAMYGENSYDFAWLLGDLPFDLYQFEQHEKELIYEGEIHEVSTEIRLIFPYAISHCHEHVWPR